MKQALTIIQIISAVSLTALILLQARGTGLGRAGTSFTRRGLEKLIFRLTFIAAAVFGLVSIASLFA